MSDAGGNISRTKVFLWLVSLSHRPHMYLYLAIACDKYSGNYIAKR